MNVRERRREREGKAKQSLPDYLLKECRGARFCWLGHGRIRCGAASCSKIAQALNTVCHLAIDIDALLLCSELKFTVTDHGRNNSGRPNRLELKISEVFDAVIHSGN